MVDIWSRRIPTPALNRWLQAMEDAHLPPLVKGRRLKLRYMSQAKSRPPTFNLFCNLPEAMADSYQRYLVERPARRFRHAGHSDPLRAPAQRESLCRQVRRGKPSAHGRVLPSRARASRRRAIRNRSSLGEHAGDRRTPISARRRGKRSGEPAERRQCDRRSPRRSSGSKSSCRPMCHAQPFHHRARPFISVGRRRPTSASSTAQANVGRPGASRRIPAAPAIAPGASQISTAGVKCS